MIYDHEAIEAAETRLREAQQEVDRLRAVLAAEHTAEQPRKLATWADGVAAAKARFPGRTRSEQAATGSGAADGEAQELTGAAAGRAAARRRAALRRPAGGAA